jgi:hypothetical protein
MSDERRLDAAIGLIGLGQIYRHRSSYEGQCCRCGLDPNTDRICYAEVPKYGEDVSAASELLSMMWKDANISIHFNNDIKMFEFSYGKNNTNASGMRFVSKKAPQAIKAMALYHFNIEPKEVIADCEKDCCVVNQ